MLLVQLITYFGNIAVLVPLCALLAGWIAFNVSHRDALLFLACVGAVTLSTALAKIWFAGCHYDVQHIHSLSGHTSFSVVAYGGTAVTLAAGSAPSRRWIFAAAYLAWALAIGISRVLLEAHTPQEVVAGWVLGGIGVAVFAWLYRGHERPGNRGILITALVLAYIAVLPAAHFTFEAALRVFGGWLVHRVPMCL